MLGSLGICKKLSSGYKKTPDEERAILEKENCSYEELKRTSEDCISIAFIVENLANITLSIEKMQAVNAEGKKIDGIHPYKLLGAMVLDHQTHAHYTTIRKMYSLNPIKIFFFKGIKDSLNLRAKHNSLDSEDHLEGFCLEINQEVSLIRPIIEKKSWDKLFDIVATP